jgi:hypothetical protein
MLGDSFLSQGGKPQPRGKGQSIINSKLATARVLCRPGTLAAIPRPQGRRDHALYSGPAARNGRKLHRSGASSEACCADGSCNGHMSALGLVSRALPVQTAMRNCARDEGGPFGFGDQESIPSHRKLLRLKAVVVSVAETPGKDSGRHGRERRAQANRCGGVESGLGDVRTRG